VTAPVIMIRANAGTAGMAEWKGSNNANQVFRRAYYALMVRKTRVVSQPGLPMNAAWMTAIASVAEIRFVTGRKIAMLQIWEPRPRVQL
jgi:hypothetical protein